jgi:tetratricopeptide (TPR) repeat protein
MSSSPSQRSAAVRILWLGAVVVVVAAAGYVGWAWRQKAKPPEAAPVDMVAVLRANNAGVGHMEYFQYAEAVNAFERVVEMAPSWHPGRINLGIALLNKDKEGDRDRAKALFEEVLREDNNNPYAHYCLGYLFQYEGNLPAALPHFQAVTQIDPADPDSWLYLAKSLDEDSNEVLPCLKKAVERDPYLSGAVYNLARNVLARNPEQGKAMLKELEDLRQANWEHPSGTKYTEMGRYACVIGSNVERTPVSRPGPVPGFARSEQFQVKLAEGARWATAADLGQGPVADLRRAVRARFGAVLVVLDYNGDGRPDLFLLGAVVEKGQVRDLLLRNDGNERFTDVTSEAGLAGARPSLGCCVADFDNDGRPDLLITGAGEQRLFRNTGKGGFEDVTAKAGLDKLSAVCLGAAFIDLDQDGDLDLVVTRFAATVEVALAYLSDSAKSKEMRPPTGGLSIYLNVGQAPPLVQGEIGPLLTTAFQPLTEPAALLGQPARVVNLAAGDFDGDRDLDLLVLADGAAGEFIVNDRLLHFHREPLPAELLPPGRWNGALVLDVNRDGRGDLFLVRDGGNPVLLLGQRATGQKEAGKWFQPGAVKSPPLLQAQAVDLDLDCLTDVVGLTTERKPVLLHNDGTRLVHAPDAFGPHTAWPKDLAALRVGNFRGQGLPDLLIWSEAAGLALYANQGNGNHGLWVDLHGRRGVEEINKLSCNADGFGTRVLVHADEAWATVDNVTLSAGLGQSRQPLLLGLGRHEQADVVRLYWPDYSWQAEFSPAFVQGHVKIAHHNRKPGSCPLLFAWDGRRFGFITDFLGAGSMGEMQADGGHRPPRPEESVKIEAEQLVPRDGQYFLKVSNPFDEIHYFDRLQLVALDHPADVRVYPDERFTSPGPPPTQELFAFRQEIFPVQARDHRGRDVTATLRSWDRACVDGFARRAWLGYAEEHWVELDFGDRLAQFGLKDRLVLCLAGWTEYPYPEAIWAATQAGVETKAPVLERRAADGTWQTLVADAGFPAGLPRMMTLELTGKLGGPRCVLRLRTNLEIFWDQIFVAPLLPAGAFRSTSLEVGTATLAARGCVQEYSPDGRQPTLYDHDRLETTPVARVSGRLTRLGDVTELLRELDDRFVIFGPGDEITVAFDAGRLPPLPVGWKRSFVLRTWGYTKDTGPFTAHGDTVEPLPFRAMGNYPYGADRRHPDEEYQRLYNTRPAGARR